MSIKYQRIVDKTKGKARKRVKLPQEIQDYMANLTVDMKEAQINLHHMENVKMNIWQGFDSLKQIVRILQQKGLLGKQEDWRDLMCDDCKYKKKLIEDVILLEMEGVIKGEVPQEMTFILDDWEYFLDKVKEKPPKKEPIITKVNDESKGKVTKTTLTKKKQRRKRCKHCNKLYNKVEMKDHDCWAKTEPLSPLTGSLTRKRGLN